MVRNNAVCEENIDPCDVHPEGTGYSKAAHETGMGAVASNSLEVRKQSG